MQRLMLGLDALRLQPGRHRLDALARAVEQQTNAIGSERVLAVGMPESRGKLIQILIQAPLTGALTMFNTVLNHAPSYRHSFVT
jgi:hypothetical protein